MKVSKKKLIAHILTTSFFSVGLWWSLVILTSPLALVFLVDDAFEIREYFWIVTTMLRDMALLTLVVLLPSALVWEKLWNKLPRKLFWTVLLGWNCVLFGLGTIYFWQAARQGQEAWAIFGKQAIFILIGTVVMTGYWFTYSALLLVLRKIRK